MLRSVARAHLELWPWLSEAQSAGVGVGEAAWKLGPLRAIVCLARLAKAKLTIGVPSRARLALVSAAECGEALRYARYVSELAHVAVGSCDDVTGTQAHCSFSCTVRRNAKFEQSAFQEVPRTCLQLLSNGCCFRGIAARAAEGQKVQPTARLLVHNQVKCELCV